MASAKPKSFLQAATILTGLVVIASVTLGALWRPLAERGAQDPVPARADARQDGLPAVGEAAPGFRLNDHTGRAVAVGGKAKGWTVLAFYPKASTPGCTREVCSLRDAAPDFEAAGVQTYGISLDDVAAQAAFAEAQQLGYPLLSDPDGSVARKYGVLVEGRGMARRVTFVIDDAGVLRHIDDQVDVAQHGAQLLEVIAKLRG